MTKKPPTNKDLEEVIKAFTPKIKPPKKIPTTKGHPNKKNEGVFQPYYGTKFFCTQTGMVFELKERDPGLGLNVLRMHRNSYRRMLLVDKARIERGLYPNYIGDIYLSDAETILLLREYPLPHLGLDLKLVSRENIQKALDNMDVGIDALIDEIEIRRKNRYTIWRLGWKNPNIKVKVKPIKVKEAMGVKEARDGLFRDTHAFEGALIEEGLLEKPVKIVGRPKHLTAMRPKRHKTVVEPQ